MKSSLTIWLIMGGNYGKAIGVLSFDSMQRQHNNVFTVL